MAMITVTGYPCSGKSRRAQQIKDVLERNLPRPMEIVIISDDSLQISRSAYAGAATEKIARATFFSAATREVRPDRIVILDGLNGIKGFRYQLYCVARERSCRVCTVHVVAPPDSCKEWNRNRDQGHAYDEETLDNLITRYEEPNPNVRWDSPLFTVGWDEENVREEIVAAVTTGVLKPPNAATHAPVVAKQNHLQKLDSVTLAVVSAIERAQSHDSVGGPTKINVDLGGEGTTARIVALKVTLPPGRIPSSRLQRLRRQFTTLNKQAEADLADEGRVCQMFADYLEAALVQ